MPHGGEDLSKDGNDEDQQDSHHDNCHRHDGGGVNHSRFDLLLQGLGFLDINSQPVEDVVQDPPLFTGHYEVDVQFVEGLGMLSQCPRKCGPTFHTFLDVLDDFLKGLVFLLHGENIQGLYER